MPYVIRENKGKWEVRHAIYETTVDKFYLKENAELTLRLRTNRFSTENRVPRIRVYHKTRLRLWNAMVEIMREREMVV